MDVLQQTDIQTALDAIKAEAPARQAFVDYYDGNHKLAFASSKFETAFGQTLKRMRDNLCPIVVDAIADRMEVINFAGDGEKETDVSKQAWALWQREQMELVSNETHIEALKTGCAYVIVWEDDENKAKFYLQDSRNVCVIEHEETGVAIFAAKQWEKDKFIRLTLYYPDRIEKYISEKKRIVGRDFKANSFIEINIEGEDFVTENPYGVIPVFAFETNPTLLNAIPIQDALNKTVCDKLVAMEFAAFRQRWATGLEPPTDELTGVPTLPFKAGVDRLWFTNDKDTQFGEFGAADLEQFLKVADAYRLEMARVSGTPLHFFSINTSDAISGEALKTLESRFTKKAKRLCLNFGGVWSKAMKLALAIEGESSSDNLTVQWDSPEQRSEKEFYETLGLKAELGIPEEVLWEEAGYTAEDIARFKAAELNEPEPMAVNIKGQKVDGNGVPVKVNG